MKLAEIYALQMGLKIDKPYIRHDFFPLPTEKFIAIHTSCGAGTSRRYDYWKIVLDMIIPKLTENGFTIFQIGGLKDDQLAGVESLLGLDLNQTAYVLSRASLLIGVDSCFVHMAGGMDVPVVGVYGSTNSNVTGPYWHTDNSIFLDSHRGGKNPTYIDNEAVKTINMINPETIANAAFEVLDLNCRDESTTLHIGRFFDAKMVDLIPDFKVTKNVFTSRSVNVRMDYFFSEEGLLYAGGIGSIGVVTDRPIQPKVLASIKKSIKALHYEVSLDSDIDYLLFLAQSGFKPVFFTRSESDEEVSKIRLKFFELGDIERIERKRKKDLDLDKEDIKSSYYKSGRCVISKGKLYPSKAAWRGELPLSSLTEAYPVVDSDEFYEEIDYFHIFKM